MIDAALTLAVLFIAFATLTLAADGIGRIIDRRRRPATPGETVWGRRGR